MNKAPYADCDNCPLKEEPCVPTTGRAVGGLMVVGEAPGRNEVEQKVPFVGQSGKLLRSLLRHHGITNYELTNTVLCRPKGNADPPQAAVLACSQRLKHDLDGAAMVLAAGRIAAAAVLAEPRLKITQARIGPPKPAPHADAGWRVVATVHPAAVLRAPGYFNDLVTDIGKLTRPVATVGWEPPNYKVFDHAYEARIALEQVRQRYDRITLDLETGLEKDDVFEHPDRILAAGIGYKPGYVVVIGPSALRDRGVREQLGRLVTSSKVICHNGKFDLGVLRNKGIANARLSADTMLASYCLDERSGTHGLKYLGRELLGTPAWSEDIKSYRSFADVPLDALARYNAIDAAVTFDLHDLLQRQLEAEGQVGLHEFLCRASDALTVVESGGVRIDEVYRKRIDNELSVILDGQRGNLNRWVDNPNSWQQVQAALHSMGVDSPSTDKDHLAEILNRVSNTGTRGTRKIKFRTTQHFDELRSFLTLLTEYRKVNKLYGTYVQGIHRRVKDGRVYSNFTLHSTTTGRTSSKNPNLQNVSRFDPESGMPNMRRMFVPEEGNIFVQADYKGAELRVVATLARADSLAEVLRDPHRDVMSEVATAIYGDGFTKEQRVKAKSVVHGVNYGRTEHGLAKDPKLNLTEAEAKSIIDLYFKMYPELLDWQKAVLDVVFNSEEHLTTPYGRKRRFNFITNNNKDDIANEALAFPPQSIASDITLTAVIALVNDGLQVRIPVHDSILVECPVEDLEDVRRHMTKRMQEAAQEFTDWIPFPVDVEVGDSWGTLR